MVLDRLIWSELFEKFVASKYPNEKRFGLEGCEALCPGMKALIDRSVEHGTKHITIGMPHRGRLNLLADLLKFSLPELFHKIGGGSEIPEELGYSGDVISHLGMLCPYEIYRMTLTERQIVSNATLQYDKQKLKVSLLPNPSHLGLFFFEHNTKSF